MASVVRSGAAPLAAVLLLTAAILASTLPAALAGSAPSKTTSSAKKQKNAYSPAKSPVDIENLRRGTPIPRDYAVISREVKVTRGKSGTKSSNYVSLVCPGDRTIAGLADSEDLGHPMPFTFNDEETFGRGTARLYPTVRDIKVGKSRTGTLYGLCAPNA